LSRWRALRRALVLARTLAVPAPDRPIVRSTVLLTFQMKARNAPEDFQPGGCVATNFDLRLDRAKGIEGLIEQIPHNPCLRLRSRGPNVMDRQVVIHAHVALDKASHLPLLVGSVEALQDQDVAPTRRSAVAFTAALVIWMCERCADAVT
jgi:hypothetical protein